MASRRVTSRVCLKCEDGVREAYAAHGPELYRFAVRTLGDPGAAQDVVQETFLRAWRAADLFDPELASVRVWLFAIARNVVTDQRRRGAVRPWWGDVRDPEDLELVAGRVVDPSERLVQAWFVEEALSRIGEGHRQAIVETYLRDRTYQEVAAELAIPVATLRTRVFYALKALRVTLEEMETHRGAA
jgi:RNA polymerase sigma-70 factor (ECF subfamily)